MDRTSRFDENNYEFNTDSKNGVYLIHGFTNTTYETKDLAQYLANLAEIFEYQFPNASEYDEPDCQNDQKCVTCRCLSKRLGREIFHPTKSTRTL